MAKFECVMCDTTMPVIEVSDDADKTTFICPMCGEGYVMLKVPVDVYFDKYCTE